MIQIKYPKGIRRGDKLGIMAPSSGVAPKHFPRLDLTLKYLREQGFDPVEGTCLRKSVKHVSGPKEARAREFMDFWKDQAVTAIMPPWGGEILVEILPLLDFEELKRSTPKWISGFSDISTLLFALTLKTEIATLHGSNLMDLVPTQTDPLTTGLMKALARSAGESFTEHSSAKWQKKWADFVTQVDGPLNLTEPTRWKALQKRHESGVAFQGRLIGGCLDTIARLAGTPYGDIPSFRKNFSRDGVIFYFENCELLPCEFVRTLWNLRLADWFDGISGILIGRSAAPDATSEENLFYEEALHSVLGELPMPIIYDADIGHRPPQLNLINGALAEVKFEAGKGIVTQKLV